MDIYKRDHFRCVYCERSNVLTLTLDHIKPRNKGGTNESRNLVTCCLGCNCKRQHGSLRGFVLRIAEETGQDWRVIMARISSQRRRKLCSSIHGKSPKPFERAVEPSALHQTV